MAKKKAGKQAAAKRSAAKKTAKAKPPRRLSGSRKIPAKQGLRPKRADVGYKRPPAEHRFQPGESGNPAGPPRRKTRLWDYLCRWLELTPAELKRAKRGKELTVAQKTAIKHAEQLMKKGITGTAWLAVREIWNRDEGKPVEHVRYEHEEALSHEECEEIRRQQRLMQQGEVHHGATEGTEKC